jgi:hypothetical protein
MISLEPRTSACFDDEEDEMSDDRQVMVGILLLGFGELALFAILLQIAKWQRRRENPPKRSTRQVVDSTRLVCLVGFSQLTMLTIVFVIQAFSETIISFMYKVFRSEVAPWFAGLGVLVLGLVAYKFRARYKRLYGVGELGVALGAAVVAIRHVSSLSSVTSAIAALVGCIYVVVRGCINIQEGGEVDFRWLQALPVPPDEIDDQDPDQLPFIF